MQTLKLRKVGSSVGVILPKELLENMNLKEGDEVYANSTTEGLQLTPYNPDFEEAMRAFGETRVKYRNALHQLAK